MVLPVGDGVCAFWWGYFTGVGDGAPVVELLEFHRVVELLEFHLGGGAAGVSPGGRRWCSQ